MSLKVLHIIPAISPSYGGPTTAVLEICRALIAKGVEAEIATTNADEHQNLDIRLGEKIKHQDISTIFFPRSVRTKYAFSWPLTHWIKKNIKNYDLVHIHYIFCYPTLVAAHYARKFGIPYVVSPVGMLGEWPMEQKFFKKIIYLNLIEKRNLKGAAAIHYTSEIEKNASEGFNVSSLPVIIPLGINLNYIKPDIPKGEFRKKYTQYADKKLIVFLSRIHPKKGLELLIEALSKLLKTRNDFILIIAGNGEPYYESILKKHIRDSHLDSCTIFTGFLEGKDKYTLLQDADIFVLPSYQENFGFAVVEAMSMGVPVIVSDQVDICREIEQFEAGKVVPCDALPLAVAIQDLLDDEEQRLNMGENGKRLVSEKFNQEKMADKLIDLYESTLRKSKSVGSL